MAPTEIPARRYMHILYACKTQCFRVSISDRKRGRKPDDEEPEIKRQRFLERNRAAASRCRAKKKVWVDSLENKCKDIETMNQNLSQEVAMLRSEVQQLKSILIAHKDCPLIVQQNQVSTNAGEFWSELHVRMLYYSAVADLGGEIERQGSNGGVTLLSQLSSMPSMSPLITSPVPSVGSVVPNMHNAAIILSNGLDQLQAPEVRCIMYEGRTW